uniref:Uncharacterized protein n=1 Tax=Arundo donax TaxID=35708 RepID=A0A0A8XPZ5_ARUDO
MARSILSAEEEEEPNRATEEVDPSPDGSPHHASRGRGSGGGRGGGGGRRLSATEGFSGRGEGGDCLCPDAGGAVAGGDAHQIVAAVE